GDGGEGVFQAGDEFVEEGGVGAAEADVAAVVPAGVEGQGVGGDVVVAAEEVVHLVVAGGAGGDFHFVEALGDAEGLDAVGVVVPADGADDGEGAVVADPGAFAPDPAEVRDAAGQLFAEQAVGGVGG